MLRDKPRTDTNGWTGGVFGSITCVVHGSVIELIEVVDLNNKLC